MDASAEWLETDGRGGFASGTVGGERTRRYHALLLAARRPPTDRVVLVNGVDACVVRDGERTWLGTQRYLPDVVAPEPGRRAELVAFESEPWPRWRWRLADGLEVTQQIVVPHGRSEVAVVWEAPGAAPGTSLEVRPFLSGRDYHALHRANETFDFGGEAVGARVRWHPYRHLPWVEALADGTYEHAPVWYRDFLYAEERARGLDCVEDLAAPGIFRWDLARGEAVLLLGAREPGESSDWRRGPGARARWAALRDRELRRRRRFTSPLHRAADQYVVVRGEGRTIVAGYPWFTDWGRDTFIALRGICLAGDRLADACEILVEWAGAVSEGMLPNRFPDRGDAPEFNAVDASLWYVVAVHELLARAAARGLRIAAPARRALDGAVLEILTGYARSTRYGIALDADGLLRAGAPGVQLTWMDAKVGDWVVTPRAGKPVEVQALWLNALRIGAALDGRWAEPLERGLAAFRARFPLPDGGLADVIDAGHEPGAVDASCRPNQLFAVGGLPFALLGREAAARVVDVVERRLLTPLGLRSLAPNERGYAPVYAGGVLERDGAYHQGTVWPWLIGPFVEAWLRAHGDGPERRAEARRRFLGGLDAHLGVAGLGHVSEVADAEVPHRPGGCPFQAWSVGELLRLETAVLGDAPVRPYPLVDDRAERPEARAVEALATGVAAAFSPITEGVAIP